MFQHRELGLIQTYQLGATLLMTLLYWGWYFLLGRLGGGTMPEIFSEYLRFYFFLVLTFQVSFLRGRQYDIFSVSSGVTESHRFISPHLLFSASVSLIYLVMTRESEMSRLFLLLYFGSSYIVLLAFTRYLALDLLRFFFGRHKHRLLIIGQPHELINIDSLLEKARLFGFETVGMATEASSEMLPPGIPHLGSPENLAEILDTHQIGNIFIIGSPRDRRMLGGWLRLAETRGCRVSLVNDLDLFLQRRLSYFRCDNIDLIELRQEPLQNMLNRAIKRTYDIILSLPVVLFILPPLMVFVWLCQRIQAPGPLFFRQVRSGLGNQRFTILKFRTMYADLCESSAQATVADERIFPIGRLLRRFSLDEFPQFLNVLLGHMSLVGPRPHMLQHDALFAEQMASYRIRSFVKPGITGLAQIRGFRGEAIGPEDVILRVACDIEYIEKWEPMLDIRILWLTATQLIRPPQTAY